MIHLTWGVFYLWICSIRNLKRERELIVKNLKSGLTAAQRDTIYKQWGIPVDAKERKIQLANLIWTNPQNEEHIKMSADLVARLFGLWSTNHGSASKEMFQLSFSPPSSLEKSWFDGWTSVAHLFGSQEYK
jgi:centromeric protein E